MSWRWLPPLARYLLGFGLPVMLYGIAVSDDPAFTFKLQIAALTQLVLTLGSCGIGIFIGDRLWSKTRVKWLAISTGSSSTAGPASSVAINRTISHATPVLAIQQIVAFPATIDLHTVA
jgi:hypothetical protein